MDLKTRLKNITLESSVAIGYETKYSLKQKEPVLHLSSINNVKNSRISQPLNKGRCRFLKAGISMFWYFIGNNVIYVGMFKEDTRIQGQEGVKCNFVLSNCH